MRFINSLLLAGIAIQLGSMARLTLWVVARYLRNIAALYADCG